MSGRHELKVWPQFFDAVIRGDKMFEVRGNDRDFQTGDEVRLREWDPKKYELEPAPLAPAMPGGFPAPMTPPSYAPPKAPGIYTGRECTVCITYVLHGGKFGLPSEAVIFSFDAPREFENEEGNTIHNYFNPEY